MSPTSQHEPSSNEAELGDSTPGVREERHGVMLFWPTPIGCIAWAVLGLLVFEALSRILVGIAGDTEEIEWYDAATQLRVEMMEERGSADTVFVGTSMAWQAFSPETMGASDDSFNAGLAGLVPVVVEPWLLDEVVPRLSPQRVVWGLSSLDFAPNYGEQQLDLWNDARATSVDWLGRLDSRLSNHSVLIDQRAQLRNPSALFHPESSDATSDLVKAREITGDGGERQEWTVDTSAERAAVQRARLRGYGIDKRDVAAIARVAIELQALDIELILVSLPIPQRFVDLHPNGSANVRDANFAIALLGERLKVTVVDMTEGWLESDFVDYTHLGPEAVDQFGQQVRPFLWKETE